MQYWDHVLEKLIKTPYKYHDGVAFILLIILAYDMIYFDFIAYFLHFYALNKYQY